MKRTLVILLAILAIAAALRFFRLDAQSFWNDEGTSARVAERSLPLITAAAIGDIHPPLYYYALHFWRGLWGKSELALRGFSAALGVVLVWLIYLLGRRLFDEPTALVAASVAAINPFQVYYSQEARMYVLLAVWAAASTYFLVRCVGQDGALSYAGYVLTAAAGVYTHYAFPFVLLVHNLIVAAWLLTQRRGWPRRLAMWIGMQAAVVVLYLPWLSVALARLPEWKSPAPPYQLGPALLDTLRWFALGRTIPTAQVTAALGVVGLGCWVSLWPARNTQSALHSTLLLSAWWLVPIALIFALGLYKEAYLKFLLASSPAFCLLFGHGIVKTWRAASHAVQEREKSSRLLARFRQALIVVLLVFVTVFNVRSLSNLYFDPAYARDDYRGIAQRVKRDLRPGDAILLEAPNQWEAFTYYYGDAPNVIPMGRVRPVTAEMAAGDLSKITSSYERLFVLYWAETEPDPNRYVERWLNDNTYKASEDWFGAVRLAVYAAPAALSNQPDHTLDIQFGDSIQLRGYSLAGDAFAPGDIAQLTLFWQAKAPISTRYKVFVHVLGANDSIVAQVDREPGGGLVPTTIWQPGQLVADRYGVAIPPGAAPDRYRIEIGLYGLDEKRLDAVQASSGISIGDRVILTQITVAR